MAEIFINYRRADSASAAGRLADRLTQRFGRERVFLDRDAIEPGADFSQKLREAIQAATVVIVIIGRDWLTQRAPDGTRRLDQAADYVRREIETALENHVPTIPVLVEGALLPGAHELPSTIRSLVRLNAHELSDRRWSEDVDALIRSLEKSYALEPETPTGDRESRRPYASIGQYFSALVDLMCHPTKTLLSRNLGGRNDFPDAIAFGLLTTAMVTALLVGLLPTEKTYWAAVMIMPIVWINLALLLSVPLYAAWRLVGAQAAYRRISTPLFYQMAVVFIALHLIVGIHAFIISIGDLTFGDRVLEILRDGNVGKRKLEAIEAMVNDLIQGNGVMFAVGTLVSVAVAVACLGWLIVAWGVYRRTLDRTRWQSAFAFAGFVLLAVLPPYLLVWLAQWVNTT
jgi:hypothetical protein